MNPPMPPIPVDTFDFNYFVGGCLALALRSRDLAEYQRRYLELERDLFPPPSRGNLRDDDALRRRLGLVLARVVWSAAPLPAFDFACPPLAVPARGDACYCGSGTSYRHCCEPLTHNAPMRNVNLMQAVLERLPRTQWKQLPHSRVDIERVIAAAVSLLRGGDADAVQALLEPWLDADDGFIAPRRPLLDLLLDAYSDLGRKRRKSALLKRALQVGDSEIRSSALQRLVTIESDAGRYARAWDYFAQAVRVDPDAPSLAVLQVTLLLSEGREDEGKACATSWLARLAHRRAPDIEPLLDALRRIERDGARVLHDYTPS